MAGEFRSVFRGTGVEFESVREYVPGDDVRSIDWNVTARAGKPFVKRFVEERERSILLAVDRSASLRFGSGAQSKAELVAEVCAVLALAAGQSRDRVGLLQFTDRVESMLPPERGPARPYRILHELFTHAPLGTRTDLGVALSALEKRTRRRSVLFVISDFAAAIPTKAMQRLARRHDVVAVWVSDPRERELRGGGIVECVDPETGEAFRLDLDSRAERDAFAAAAAERRKLVADALTRGGAQVLALETGHDILPPLLRFFERRERQVR